jgi:hypothetical protein
VGYVADLSLARNEQVAGEGGHPQVTINNSWNGRGQNDMAGDPYFGQTGSARKAERSQLRSQGYPTSAPNSPPPAENGAAIANSVDQEVEQKRRSILFSCLIPRHPETFSKFLGPTGQTFEFKGMQDVREALQTATGWLKEIQSKQKWVNQKRPEAIQLAQVPIIEALDSAQEHLERAWAEYSDLYVRLQKVEEKFAVNESQRQQEAAAAAAAAPASDGWHQTGTGVVGGGADLNKQPGRQGGDGAYSAAGSQKTEEHFAGNECQTVRPAGSGQQGWGSGSQKNKSGGWASAQPSQKNNGGGWSNEQPSQKNSGGWGNEQPAHNSSGGWGGQTSGQNKGNDAGWGSSASQKNDAGWGNSGPAQNHSTGNDNGWGSSPAPAGGGGWDSKSQHSHRSSRSHASRHSESRHSQSNHSSQKNSGGGWNQNNNSSSGNDGWGNSGAQQNNSSGDWNQGVGSQRGGNQGGSLGGNDKSSQHKKDNHSTGWDKKSNAGRSFRSEAGREIITSSPQPIIKPYWAEWRGRGDSAANDTSDRNTKKKREARNVYAYPAEPLPEVPAGKTGTATHGVQAGKGADYEHVTRCPEYIDSFEKPYAVFSFKYRSPKKLEKILGRNITPEVERVREQAEKDRLASLPKNKLIEELMKARGQATPPRTSPSAKGSANKPASEWAAKSTHSNKQGSGWGSPASNKAPSNAGGGWGSPGSNKAPSNAGGWGASGGGGGKNSNSGGWGGGDNNNGGGGGSGGWGGGGSNHGGKSQAGSQNNGESKTRSARSIIIDVQANPEKTQGGNSAAAAVSSRSNNGGNNEIAAAAPANHSNDNNWANLFAHHIAQSPQSQAPSTPTPASRKPARSRRMMSPEQQQPVQQQKDPQRGGYVGGMCWASQPAGQTPDL